MKTFYLLIGIIRILDTVILSVFVSVINLGILFPGIVSFVVVAKVSIV